MRVITKAVTNLNGISIAYVMGVVNAAMSLLLAFGVSISNQQDTQIVTFVNAILILMAHVSHRLGENESTKNVKANANNSVTAESQINES